MDVFDLAAKITLDTSEYVSALDGARSMLSGIQPIGVAAFQAIGKAALDAGKYIFSSASDIAEYGDNIDKMSQKIGISAEAYQEWDAVMQHSGASVDALQGSMRKLSQAAETGNEAFEQLGISEAEVASLSKEDLFERVISGLQEMEDGTERTYIAQQLLGRGAAEFGALLNTSAEETQAMRDRVHELGGVMSDEAVKSAAAFQDQLQDLTTAFDGLKRGLMSDFMPSITTVMSGLTEIFAGNYDEGLEQIKDGIDAVVNNVNEILPQALDIGANIISALSMSIIENIPTLLTSFMDAVETIGDAIMQNMPMITSVAQQIVLIIVSGITNMMPEFAQSGIDIVLGLANGITSALPELISTVTNTFSSVLLVFTDPKNITDIVQAAVDIVNTFVDSLMNAIPILLDALPTIIDNVLNALLGSLPILINGVTTLVNSIAQRLPTIIQSIARMIPRIIRTVANSISQNLPVILQGVISLVQAVAENLPSIITSVVQMLPEIMQEIVDALLVAVPQLIDALVIMVTMIADQLPTIIQGLVDALPVIIDAISEALPELIELFIDAIMALMPAIIDGYIRIAMAIAENLPTIVKAIIDALPAIVTSIVNGFRGIIGGVGAVFRELFVSIGTAISTWWAEKKAEIKNGIDQFVIDVKTWFEQLPYNIGATLAEIINTFGTWLNDALNWVRTDVPQIINGIVDWFKQLPDKILIWLTDVIVTLATWVHDMIETAKTEIPRIIDTIVEFFEELPAKAWEWGKDMIDQFFEGFKSAWNSGKRFIDDVAQGFKDKLGHSHPVDGPLADDYKWMPDMMDLFIKGIKDNEGRLQDQIADTFNLQDQIQDVNAGSLEVSSTSGMQGRLITPTVNREVTVVLELDKVQFAKTVFELNNGESQRMGVALANV